jgi:hypothetical protein
MNMRYYPTLHLDMDVHVHLHPYPFLLKCDVLLQKLQCNIVLLLTLIFVGSMLNKVSTYTVPTHLRITITAGDMIGW